MDIWIPDTRISDSSENLTFLCLEFQCLSQMTKWTSLIFCLAFKWQSNSWRAFWMPGRSIEFMQISKTSNSSQSWFNAVFLTLRTDNPFWMLDESKIWKNIRKMNICEPDLSSGSEFQTSPGFGSQLSFLNINLWSGWITLIILRAFIAALCLAACAEIASPKNWEVPTFKLTRKLATPFVPFWYLQNKKQCATQVPGNTWLKTEKWMTAKFYILHSVRKS